MAKPAVKLLRLCRMPIFEQLQLEEALLRSTPHNWMLLNDRTPGVSIVMGISGCVCERALPLPKNCARAAERPLAWLVPPTARRRRRRRD